jgi:CPA2 family monovalent cation:H+ antiporter-2
VLVGPFTPGFVAHGEIAGQLAEVGVILLMFGMRLHFHLDELLAVKRVAAPGALLWIAIAGGLGIALSKMMGWSTGAGLMFGLAISVASTVVLLRMLADHDTLHTQAGHIAIGWLIVEDVFTVFALVLVPVLMGREAKIDAASIASALASEALSVHNAS